MAGRPLITANMVTAARLLAMPYLAWLLYTGEPTYWWCALFLGTAIGCTDFVDGYLARKQGPTVLGSLLDPIADKVLIASWYLPMVDVGLLPAWAVALILLREFLVTGLRSAFEQRNMRMKTSYLAKVKTWVQMQGLGVAVLMVLLEDRPDIMMLLLALGAALPFLAVAGVYVARRRLHRGALIMGVLQGVAVGLFHVLGTGHMVMLVLVVIVALTWISGADYLVTGLPALRRAGDLRMSDVVRVLSAIAVPATAILCMTQTSVARITVLGVVCIELAVGGLDNLLSHHRAAAAAGAWASRTLGAALLLALATSATWLGYPAWSAPLAIAALAVCLVGGTLEFVRGRDYYLDARLRDKAAASVA